MERRIFALLLNLLSALFRWSLPSLRRLLKKTKAMRRIVTCDRKGLVAYFLASDGHAVGSISVSSHGNIDSTSKPDAMTLATWLIQCAKVLHLARKIFAEVEIPIPCESDTVSK